MVINTEIVPVSGNLDPGVTLWDGAIKPGFKPTLVILFAQFTNGLLLPILAGVLLWIMNDLKIMGDRTNSRWLNLCGILVIGVTVILSIKSIAGVFNTFD